ncbi:MAG: tRNA uridine-5-carboxymethylaminomethyl(34) synthesis GTPase MnmE [Pseudomonadota bacterium]|nr:tRNA uridine-5-carboxymethylaminomethyl(34) synthesis GTPase MnmE [Pseudomonadota bacterium]
METGAPRKDTIAAIATAHGRAGIGVVRVSGPACQAIGAALLGTLPPPRVAQVRTFRDAAGAALDQGLALYFPGPASFTGEDVLELQGHGSPIVLALVLERICALGARIARPGEFSLRAFLNDRLDLTQAEAIADLIDAGSAAAARSAMQSLQGAFAQRVRKAVDALIAVRVEVEAAIDFSDEEDVLGFDPAAVQTALVSVTGQLRDTRSAAATGQRLRDGLRIAIVGPPNAGKSSLLNALTGTERAIVSGLPGTTRDLIQADILIDEVPVHLVDTAGLRSTHDPIEAEGIRRSRSASEEAEVVLLLLEAGTTPLSEVTCAGPWEQALNQWLPTIPRSQVTLVRTKVDLTGESSATAPNRLLGMPLVNLSIHQPESVQGLRKHLLGLAGVRDVAEAPFIARRRHLDALDSALALLEDAIAQFEAHRAAELLAEDLRQVQLSLDQITGQFSNEDLLSHIFSSFCIGK